jgi:hypothetical protein
VNPDIDVGACLVITPSVTGNCQQDSEIVISINTSLWPNCQIIYAQAAAGSECQPPAETFPTQSVTFPAISSPGYSQFAVAVQCT